MMLGLHSIDRPNRKVPVHFSPQRRFAGRRRAWALCGTTASCYTAIREPRYMPDPKYKLVELKDRKRFDSPAQRTMVQAIGVARQN